jgi:hypothetical protein
LGSDADLILEVCQKAGKVTAMKQLILASVAAVSLSAQPGLSQVWSSPAGSTEEEQREEDRLADALDAFLAAFITSWAMH